MHWLVLALLGMGLTGMTVADERKSYHGYQLIQIIPKSREIVLFLRKLMIEDVELDFFLEPSQVGKTVEILVGPQGYRRLQVQLRKQNINFDVIIKNYQTVLDPMWKAIDERRSTKGGQVFNINDFNTMDDINNWMVNTLLLQCRAGIQCQVYTIGNSALGRPIHTFHIYKAGSGRKAYWLDGGIHAREWLASATAVKVLDHLVNGRDANAVRLTEDYDWYITPVLNVDGYDYSWTSDRNWRKNRRNNPGSTCIGTDLNRNFDWRWGKDGVSTNPCSDVFCGSAAGSEPETQAIQQELVRLGQTLLASVTLHSYGSLWIFPWGNTVNFEGALCDRPTDYADLMRVSNLAADAVQATYNTRWERGNACEVQYETSGCMDDYAKGVAGIKYAFCPEMRGNAFAVPADQIELSFREFFNGLVAMVDAIDG